MPTLLLLHCSAPNQRASGTRRATYDKNAPRNEGLVARRAAPADAKSFAPCRRPCLALPCLGRTRSRTHVAGASMRAPGGHHQVCRTNQRARGGLLYTRQRAALGRRVWRSQRYQAVRDTASTWAVSYAHRSATGTTPRGAARAARSSAHARLRLVGAFVPRKPKAAADPIERPAASERPPSRASCRPVMQQCSASAAARARARRFGSIG